MLGKKDNEVGGSDNVSGCRLNSDRYTSIAIIRTLSFCLLQAVYLAKEVGKGLGRGENIAVTSAIGPSDVDYPI